VILKTKPEKPEQAQKARKGNSNIVFQR